MATKFDPREVSEAYQTLYGHMPTLQEAWFLTKLMKHARGRCISNVAFNNYMNASFSNLRFKQVQKTDDKDQVYEGLEITELVPSTHVPAPVSAPAPMQSVPTADPVLVTEDLKARKAIRGIMSFLHKLVSGKIGATDPFVTAAAEEQIKLATKVLQND